MTTLARAIIGKEQPPEQVVLHLPRVGPVVAKLPNGATMRLWSRGDDGITSEVFWRGWDAHEPEVSRPFFESAQRASVVLDIGAHVGYFALLAALANPAAAVYAFEPLPAVLDRLRRNIASNGVTARVTAVASAAGARDGSAEFFHVDGVSFIPSSSSLSAAFMRGTPNLVSSIVPVARVDSFVARHHVKKVDLVKIDTETTEDDVLRGMIDTLRRDRPSIFCEVLSRGRTRELMSILQPLGICFGA